jgi:O-antigen ligase
MNDTHPSAKYSKFVITLLLLFPIVINSVKIFSSLILLILAVLGAYISITKKKNPFQVQELKILSWLTVGYFSVILLSILISDGFSADFHSMGRKLQFLLAPLIMLAIFQVDLPLKRLLLSLKVGLIIIGSITITQFIFATQFQIHLGDTWGRPSGMMNQNIFGDITVSMLFLSIVCIFKENKKERIITLIAVLAGVIAIFLSASRGSWLSFLILFIIYIMLVYKPFLKNHNKRKLSLALLVLTMFVFIGTQTNADKKISKAISEVQDWRSGDTSRTSNGLRMEMWKSGMDAASDSPWFGYGYKNANKIASKYASNNNRRIKDYSHLHNEYITNLVSAGIVGLIALLTLLIMPLIYFYKNLRDENSYYYAAMGILLCAGYITFGFTHIAFGEEHINAFYVLFISLLLPKVMKKNA